MGRRVDILCKVHHEIVVFGEEYKDEYGSKKRDFFTALELLGKNNEYSDLFDFYSCFRVKDYDEKYVRNTSKMVDFIDIMNQSDKLRKEHDKVLEKLMKMDRFRRVIGDLLKKPSRKVLFGMITLSPSYYDNLLRYYYNDKRMKNRETIKREYEGWYLKSEVYDIEIQYDEE